MGTLDQTIFLALNFDGGLTIDRLMFIISGRITWLPLYLLIIWLIWRQYGWKTTLIAVAMIAIAVGLADQICNLFKDGFRMLRPNHTEALAPLMHFPLRDGVPYVNSGLYGTVSAHAATVTSIAVLACSFVRRRWFAVVAAVWVALVCYSRIYIGAHFPSQILFGIILGLLIGWAGTDIARRFRLYKPRPVRDRQQSPQ